MVEAAAEDPAVAWCAEVDLDTLKGLLRSSAPMFKLVHGLPGSGKTTLLRWLRGNFEDVWQWTFGVHFMFLAPMNTMAANIHGCTIHSWGEIKWKNKQGVIIGARKHTEDDVSSMGIKGSSLRFLCIDEIEACGAGLLANLEKNTSRGAPKHFKNPEGSTFPAPYEGVNTFFLETFGNWTLQVPGPLCQIPRTMQIVLSHNWC